VVLSPDSHSSVLAPGGEKQSGKERGRQSLSLEQLEGSVSALRPMQAPEKVAMARSHMHTFPATCTHVPTMVLSYLGPL
jgi:hypothetical protein